MHHRTEASECFIQRLSFASQMVFINLLLLTAAVRIEWAIESVPFNRILKFSAIPKLSAAVVEEHLGSSHLIV